MPKTFLGVLFKKTSEIHQKGNNQLGKIQSHKISVDAQNFCFDGPRINPRMGWTRAGFV